VARLTDLNIDGSHLNLDGGFDSRHNRKAIFNAGLIANIKENPRNRKTPKRGRKRLFNAAIHSLRLCVERTFAWEDKFKRLLLRFEFKQQRQQPVQPYPIILKPPPQLHRRLQFLSHPKRHLLAGGDLHRWPDCGPTYYNQARSIEASRLYSTVPSASRTKATANSKLDLMWLERGYRSTRAAQDVDSIRSANGRWRPRRESWTL
jgi:hypothetical protein